MKKKNVMPRWTAAEEEILRTYYPTEGEAVSARFKNHSRDGCWKKASKLGLKGPTGEWSKEELETLRQYYPSEGGKVVKRLPGRTERAAMNAAKKLGIRYTGKRAGAFIQWTEEEDAILRRYYPAEGAVGCRNRLEGRSLEACRTRAGDLGVRKKPSRPFWTPNRDNILRQHWGAITNDKLCDILGLMNPETLYKRAKQLGLERQKREKRERAKTYGRYVRRCHTCGKPTDGSYWCRECKAERLRKAGWSPKEITAVLGEDESDGE